MNFSFAEIIKSLQNYWKKLTRSQRVVLVLAPLIVAIALFSLILWASRPQYTALFTKQSTTEAGSITAKLKELKIEYQLADNGATILVPQKQLSEARLELANAGLPSQSTFSFENLNTIRLGETDAVTRLRYILGLQNELETTIGTLDGVELARVHIVMPEQSLFQENQKDTTAAVTIKRAYGTEMSTDQIRAIANLLAYSVEGLTTDKVTIVDTNGNVLSDALGNSSTLQGLTSNQLQIQQAVEDKIEKSVQTMLDKVFGAGKTIVRANAVLDFNQKTITSKVSSEGAVLSREVTSEKSSNQSASGGVPGTTTNVPTYSTGGTGDTTSTSEKSTSIENFQPSVTQEETVVSPGQINRLTISVMADSDSITEAQLQSIKNIVSSATGIDVNRGDIIQVANLPFNKTTMLEEKAAMADAARTSNILFYARIAGGVVAGIIFLIILLRFRSRGKNVFEQIGAADGQKLVTIEEAEQLLASQLDAERQADLKLARKKAKTSDEIEREKVRKEVDKYTKDNPDDVARLVKTWLAEE